MESKLHRQKMFPQEEKVAINTDIIQDTQGIHKLTYNYNFND